MWGRLRERIGVRVVEYAWWTTLVALVAIAAFFVMGFAQTAAAHDVFHDLRHALGVPCH